MDRTVEESQTAGISAYPTAAIRPTFGPAMLRPSRKRQAAAIVCRKGAGRRTAQAESPKMAVLVWITQAIRGGFE